MPMRACVAQVLAHCTRCFTLVSSAGHVQPRLPGILCHACPLPCHHAC